MQEKYVQQILFPASSPSPTLVKKMTFLSVSGRSRVQTCAFKSTITGPFVVLFSLLSEVETLLNHDRQLPRFLPSSYDRRFLEFFTVLVTDFTEQRPLEDKSFAVCQEILSIWCTKFIYFFTYLNSLTNLPQNSFLPCAIPFSCLNYKVR